MTTSLHVCVPFFPHNAALVHFIAPKSVSLHVWLLISDPTSNMPCIQELWASVGQAEAEVKLRRAVHGGSLPSLEKLLEGVDAVLNERPNKRAQVRGEGKAAIDIYGKSPELCIGII